jgi:hypothetical protein
LKKSALLAAPSVALGIAMFAMPGIASASTGTSYQANLQPVALNTPAGAASGQLTLTLNGSQATIHETVSGLGDKLPTDTATLNALRIPTSFAGAPFPHVQHIHINAMGQCPTASADTDKNGVISIPEGAPSYGPIGTTLSVKGGTTPSSGDDVTIAPGGGSFTYDRTITLDAATLASVKANKAVIVVHGLNPSNAPKAALTDDNQDHITLPGENGLVKLVATAPALCGALNVSQMSSMPNGAAATGGGSTAGIQDEGLLAMGGALVAAGAVAGGVALRRRSATSAR